MSLFQGKKIFILGFIIVLLFAIPLTVYLSQQRQQTTSQATKATTLSFSPDTKNMNVGDSASFDITMNPGTNLVSFVKLTINYDSTKFSVDPNNCFTWNTTAFPGQTPLQGPTCNTPGAITVSLSVGNDPAKIISSITKVGTITLKAIAGTNGSTTAISMPAAQNQVLSIGTGDQASENVLLGQPPPATVTIGGSSTTNSTGTTSTGLTCSSLVLDRTPSGTAPYSVTFTASGKDTNGTISKVTFTFGDGQVQDVTTGGGIGTNTVNTQISHTYNNAGTFNASAVLTNNQNKTSDTTSCKITITTSAATSGSSGGSGGTSTGTGTSSGAGSAVVVAPTEVPTEIPTVTLTATPTIPPTGPGDKIIGIGAAGIMLSILGALLLAF